jgi:predicted lipoprotein with Yx(FWY)xxD motif
MSAGRNTMLRRISVRTLGFGVSLAAVTLMAVACGGSSTPAAGGGAATTTAAAATAPATSASSDAGTGAGTVIKTASGSAGIWLTDQTGKTLYIYTKDTGTTSVCYAACATAWPPFTATGSVTVNGQFLDASLIGSTKRTDGTTQVTYGGHPLYYYVKDTAPNQTTGQGVGGVWYLLGPKANVMK